MAEMTPDDRLWKAINDKADDVERIRSLWDNRQIPDVNLSRRDEYLYHEGEIEEEVWPLHKACYLKLPNIVDFLLQKGALQYPCRNRLCTPLHLAAGNGCLEIIKVLLKSFPNLERRNEYVNAGDKDGRTALHQYWSPKVTDFLLHHGADISKRDNRGNTPVHEASWVHKSEAIEALIGSDSKLLGDTNNSGQTCLHIATKSMGIDTVKWLLKKMELKHIQQQDKGGHTAWDIAARVASSGEPSMTKVAVAFLEKEIGNNLLSPNYQTEIGGVKIMTGFHINSLCGVLPHLPGDFRVALSNELDIRDTEDKVGLIRYREPSCLFSDGVDSVSIVMPFIHLQSVSQVKYWRDKTEVQEGKNGTRQAAAFARLTESWNYCYSKTSRSYGICLPLTLDEYCCPVLPSEILDRRNKDQVLIRTKKAELSLKDFQEVPDTTQLIVVSQLWLWKYENRLVISPISDTHVVEGELKIKHLDTIVGRMFEYTGEPLRRIGLIISDFLEYLDDPPNDDPTHLDSRKKTGPILNDFERAITLVSEQVNKYLEHIAMDRISSEQEKKYLHEIGDIREELSMIKRVLFQQDEVWKEFALTAWAEFWPYGPDGRMVIPKEIMEKATSREQAEWRRISRIPAKFAKYRRRIEQLDEDADRVEKSISLKLDLMAKHAGIRETHASAIMSAAVFGFTIITIIFTPLSFFASLFALPIDRFQASQVYGRFSNETGMYTTNYIGKFVATGEIVSVAVTLFAMWIAVRYGMGVHIFGPLWGQLKRIGNRSVEFLKSVGKATRNSDGTNVVTTPPKTTGGTRQSKEHKGAHIDLEKQ